MDDQPQTAPARESYMNATATFDTSIATRTAVREAAFFLPHLRPGMRLLDIGCGPGSITLGLAAVVAPGEVVGIDLRPEAVEQARALAAERRVSNVRFEVASVYAQPFADPAFDAVFAHAVLMHLAEPVRALAEVRRVLRPGGIVGLSDLDIDAQFIYPPPVLWPEYTAVREQVRRHSGGDPTVARRHRHILLEAGFARAEAGATAETAGSLERTRWYAGFVRAMMPGIARIALAEGWADQATLDAMQAGVDAWAERPDAFIVNVWCETIGWTET
jgi:SAM-dependent methyltransferase